MAMNKLFSTCIFLIVFGINAQIKSEFIDIRNYKTYKTVDIASQTWLAENLNVETFRNGDSILQVKTEK
jgi:hypothetical protein